MSCYTTELASGANVNQQEVSEVSTKQKWHVGGSLTDDLIALFKEKAQKYGLDWKWLAALAYVESNWRTNVKNQYGYYGLFQFRESTIDKGYSIYKPEDQTEIAAKNMSAAKNKANGYGMTNEDCYLYAGMSHNCGIGGAQFLLGKASPKNVFQMVQVELTLPDSEFKYKFMSSSAKRKEISEYPSKMKSAYVSICAKYT